MAKTTKRTKAKPSKSLTTPQAVDKVIWDVCNVLRRTGNAGAMQYVPELSWLLFLRVLDEWEDEESEAREALSLPAAYSVPSPFRWRDWAAPYDDKEEHPPVTPDGKRRGWKRQELTKGAAGNYFEFVNGKLLPYLKGLAHRPYPTSREQVISQVLASVERVRVDTETNFQDVLDRLDALSDKVVDKQHIFLLSQVYEGLLLKMGEKGNDGGQFFTPREVIRAMIQVIDPQPGETIYDPCCGTGGFLAQSYDHVRQKLQERGDAQGNAYVTLRERTFYGREKESLVFPITLANLLLHGIEEPHIWHGNTLTGWTAYGGLFQDAPGQYNVVLTNPPFGGKENLKDIEGAEFKTTSTQVVFLQHVMKSLAPGGRCGIVLDEGVLFRTTETAFVQTKQKLLEDCDVWCIVSLPGGVFTTAGAGVKTNLVFFNEGSPTERIWYYDLSRVKVTKRQPLTLEHFEEFFRLLPDRADSDNSWTVDYAVRWREACDQARPLEAQAEEKQQQAAAVKARLSDLKRAKPKNLEAIDAAQQEYDELVKAARALKSEAWDIKAAATDLKAVNPHAKSEEDTRTPAELIELIEAKGREIAEALRNLKAI